MGEPRRAETISSWVAVNGDGVRIIDALDMTLRKPLKAGVRPVPSDGDDRSFGCVASVGFITGAGDETGPGAGAGSSSFHESNPGSGGSSRFKSMTGLDAALSGLLSSGLTALAWDLFRGRHFFQFAEPSEGATSEFVVCTELVDCFLA